ncbi:MAG: hypothetical protein H7A23_10590 [Leptospiraceae bacterium]|nr:hypothetical protein [Leptospiraceae bacterium]MCP5494992.1 hypothetical protein [Leptospiraceae bacterium]
MKKMLFLIILLFAIACSSSKKKDANTASVANDPTDNRETLKNNIDVVKAQNKGDIIQDDLDYINYRKRKMKEKDAVNANCKKP